mgnify:CR=1 FL=1
MHRIQCLIAAAAIAGSMTATVAKADEAADVEAVRQANATFLGMAGTRNIDAMSELWRQDDDVRAIHPFRPIDEGWDEVRAGFAALYELFPEMTVVMPEPHVQVVGDIAWVTGLEDFEGTLADGNVVEVTLRTGRIFERDGDRWLLVHHQVSPPPNEE